MSLIKMLTRKGNFVNQIEFDAVLTEGAKASAKITSNPVEYGANVNDHIVIQPMTFTLTGITSNAKTNVIAAVGAAIDSATALIRKTASQQLWDDLLELHTYRVPFTLVQGLRSYDNIVVESLEESQDVETANVLQFSATLKEIIYVGTVTVPLATFAGQDVSDKATPTKAAGIKALGGF